jgi:hypothetical protein
MAEVGSNIPRFVPLAHALDCLHDRDVGALTRSAPHRRYTQPTLERLLRQLDQLGARVRGNIDHGSEEWVECLLNYRVGYWTAPARGRARIAIPRLESQYTYPLGKVNYHVLPAKHPNAAEPYYRRIVDNVKVETAPLVRWLTANFSTAGLKVSPPVLGMPSLGSPQAQAPATTRRKPQQDQLDPYLKALYPDTEKTCGWFVPESVSTAAVLTRLRRWRGKPASGSLDRRLISRAGTASIVSSAAKNQSANNRSAKSAMRHLRIALLCA